MAQTLNKIIVLYNNYCIVILCMYIWLLPPILSFLTYYINFGKKKLQALCILKSINEKQLNFLKVFLKISLFKEHKSDVLYQIVNGLIKNKTTV